MAYGDSFAGGGFGQGAGMGGSQTLDRNREAYSRGMQGSNFRDDSRSGGIGALNPYSRFGVADETYQRAQELGVDPGQFRGYGLTADREWGTTFNMGDFAAAIGRAYQAQQAKQAPSSPPSPQRQQQVAQSRQLAASGPAGGYGTNHSLPTMSSGNISGAFATATGLDGGIRTVATALERRADEAESRGDLALANSIRDTLTRSSGFGVVDWNRPGGEFARHIINEGPRYGLEGIMGGGGGGGMMPGANNPAGIEGFGDQSGTPPTMGGTGQVPPQPPPGPSPDLYNVSNPSSGATSGGTAGGGTGATPAGIGAFSLPMFNPGAGMPGGLTPGGGPAGQAAAGGPGAGNMSEMLAQMQGPVGGGGNREDDPFAPLQGYMATLMGEYGRRGM